MADTVQQVKDRLGIVDVVTQYVKLERAGMNLRSRCPFHAEKTPSFIVSPDRGTYHCFGCGVGGDIFTFVETIEGVDFKGALKILADKAGVPLVFSGREQKDDKDRLFEAMEAATLFYQTALTDAAKEYLTMRGLTEETVRAFRLGWAGDGWSTLSDHLTQKKFSEKEIVDAGLAKKGDRGLTDKFRNRIMFPLMDTAGRVVAFSGRTFGPDAHPDAPKYLNSPETALFHKSRVLYGFDRAKQTIRKHNFAVLVEGQIDLVLSHQSGFANAVAVSGTAFTIEHAALVKRMSENIVIALDADEAGFKAASRAARAALQLGLQVKVAQLPGGLDPADLILKEGPEAWRAAIRSAKEIITFLLDVLEAHAKSKENFRRAVETIVLPFLQDMQSPIAREQYETEIAARLGVSAAAVRAAGKDVPREQVRSVPVQASVAHAGVPNRVKQAYGLLLWQESLKKSALDTASFAAKLEEAIGAANMQALIVLPADEKESLRFLAEQLHEKSGSLQRSADALLSVLHRARLQQELEANTEALRQAEAAGDQEATQRLSQISHHLAQEIAKASK